MKGSGRRQTASGVPRSGCGYFENFSIVAAAKESKKVHEQFVLFDDKTVNVYFGFTFDYPNDEWVIKEEEKLL